MVSKKAAVAEDFIPTIQESAINNVAKAMFKVFVEGVDEVVPNYLEELNSIGDKKYKIRVTDPKTGNSYVRYGTREKITQLRSKGLKVELTEYGEPREGERKKGEETARATGGGSKKPKLDPVGKEDGDIDNDGDKDKTDSYLLNRRQARGAAIAKRKGVAEEFLSDAVDGQQKTGKKISEKGVDNYASGCVKISPPDETSERSGKSSVTPRSVYAHTEYEGEIIIEKATSKAQQRFMGMVYAAKKGGKPASPEVAAAAESMTKKEAKKFAKTKHKGLPEKVAEENCSPEPQQRDKRGDYAKIAMIKNKLRSMGEKNPIVMVASENVQSGPILPGERGKRVFPKGQEPKPTGAKLPPLQNAHYELEGNVISERGDEPGERDSNPDVKAHNRSLRDKYGKRKYPSGKAGYGRRPDISKDPRYGSVD